MPTDDEKTQDGKRPSSPDEAALIQKIEDRIAWPEDLKHEVQRWQDIREYVHTDAMLLDEEDAVGTNFIFRNQMVAMSLLSLQDPAPRAAPRKDMPLPGGERMPMTHEQQNEQYAKTHELVLRKQQDVSGLVDIVDGAIQDALTLPFAWIKMRVQEDPERDPVGYGRNNDQLDAIQRYQRLLADYEAGIFDEKAAEYAELKALSQLLRAYVLDELNAQIAMEEEVAEDDAGQPIFDENDEPIMRGGESLRARAELLIEDPEALIASSELPEVAHYIGFTFQQVDPEDIRWDWNVRRPEDLRYARWMAHRAWMTPADIREKWGVTDADLKPPHRDPRIGDDDGGRPSGSGEDPEYAGKDEEERYRQYAGEEDPASQGDTLAVWEYWDRVQGNVTRFVQGTGLILDSYVPTALPRRFFPFFPLMFGRATGRFLGVCDTDLQQPLQDESNRIRTWQREAQMRAHPRYMITRGLLRPSEKQRAELSIPYSMIEVERAEDVAKGIFPLVPPDYNPLLYDRAPTLLEMQQMAGVPAAALGAGNRGMTATSDSIANEQMGNQVGRRRKIVERLYRDIYQAMMEVNAQILPMRNVVEMAGPGAVWLDVGYQQVLSNFVVEVDSVPSDRAERAEELKAWVDLATIWQNLGLPFDPIPVSKKLMELMGIRENLGNYISVPMLLQMMQGMPAAGGAPAPGGPPAQSGGAPNQQAAFGEEGGAPPGEGFEDPPGPESLPGPA